MRLPQLPAHSPRPADDDRPRRTPSPRPTGVPVGPVAAAGADDLRTMLKIISDSTDARSELVDDLRDQVGGEGYLCEDKLNVAIYRLLRDILD
mgnify:FL=1